MIHLSETKVWSEEEIYDIMDIVFDPPPAIIGPITFTREDMEQAGWVFPDEQE
jgi:hypothetical protein